MSCVEDQKRYSKYKAYFYIFPRGYVTKDVEIETTNTPFYSIFPLQMSKNVEI